MHLPFAFQFVRHKYLPMFLSFCRQRNVRYVLFQLFHCLYSKYVGDTEVAMPFEQPDLSSLSLIEEENVVKLLQRSNSSCSAQALFYKVQYFKFLIIETTMFQPAMC